MTKFCNKCKTEKTLEAFRKRKNGSIEYCCKLCKSQMDKKYRETNKEKIKKQAAVRYEANKELYKERERRRRNEASEEIKLLRKQKKQEYAKNAPEDVKQRKREYDKKYFASEAGKLVTARSVHKRRAQKIASEDGTVTSQALEILKNKQQCKCNYCKTPLDFSSKGKVHLDHIVPLSKGGAHSITNVVWSCAACNLSKGSKLLDT